MVRRSRILGIARHTDAPFVVAIGAGVKLRINPDGTRLWLRTDPTPLVLGTYPDMPLRDALARSATHGEGEGPASMVTGDAHTAASQGRRDFLRSSFALAGAAAVCGATDADAAKAGTAEGSALLPEHAAPIARSTVPGKTAKAWIHSPETFGSSSYVRYSPINVVRGTLDVELRSNMPLESVVIKVMGPKGELARSSEMHQGPYVWSLDTRRLPEGNLVIDAEVTPKLPFLHAVIVVDNDGKPVSGEQWVPVGARNTLDEFSNVAWGYEWVRYPGSPRGTRLQVRKAVPFSARQSKRNLWQQAMTSTSVTRHNPSRQFTTLEGGHISVVERQSYTQADNFRLLVANCIDGPYGVGRVGSMWNGYVERTGALVGVCGQGRIARVDLEGTTQTLLGWRLKPGVAAPMFAAGGSAAQWAWVESFYEHVGRITDGPPRLDNPWQAVADPGDPNMLYIADSDNNRIVVYDAMAKTGRTFAGGAEGFSDGRGQLARFNRPRGLAWSRDGSTLYVADDHNSAIRAVDRGGFVRTLVHAARGTSVDLVRREGEFRKMRDYADMIRGQMTDGDFGAATFMHPNALQIDSDGNLITACHHPHVVVKFDLSAGTVKTLVDLPLQSLQIHHLKLAWISLAVDRWGTFGPKDQFAVAYWAQSSFQLYNADGTFAGFYLGGDRPASSGYLENGPVAECKFTNYPAFCVFGEDGSLWHGGSAGDGVYRQTLRQPTDPVVDPALYKRGLDLYTRGVPAPVYRRGWRGHSHLGETSFYDFVGKPDADIEAWIRTWPIQYDKDEIAALTSFIRWSA